MFEYENQYFTAIKTTHMKSILLLCLFIGPLYLFSQQMERSVVSSAGNEKNTQPLSLEWTLGELAVTTESNGKIIFTQGYHQADVSRLSAASSIGQFSVWPNPAEDFLTLNYQGKHLPHYVVLTDINGKKNKSSLVRFDSGNVTLDINDLRPGIYFLVLYDSESSVISYSKVCKIK